MDNNIKGTLLRFILVATSFSTDRICFSVVQETLGDHFICGAIEREDRTTGLKSLVRGLGDTVGAPWLYPTHALENPYF